MEGHQKLATHIVNSYDLVSQHASTSKEQHHPIPSLGELTKLHSELASMRKDLSARKARLRSDDERVKSAKAAKISQAIASTNAKGKDKQNNHHLHQQHPPAPSISQLPQIPKKKPPEHAQPSQPALSASAANVAKPVPKIPREPSVRSSSADLSDVEVQVKRKKDPNKKRKRKPEIPIDSEDEYSDAATPIIESIKQDGAQPKSRKTMPPAIPPASPSSIMPPQAPPVLPRANSLSDLSALPSSNPSVVKPPTARQTSPSLPLPTTTSTSGLKLKLNNLKKERSETSTPISAPSPPKRQPSTTELVQDFSLPARQYVPPQPVPEPPIPLPQRQVDVMGDFSKCKSGPQVPYHTFTSYVDPYVRAFGDDDIAYLSQKSDDYAPFVIPGLGKYYLDAWIDDDWMSNAAATALGPSQPECFRPDELTGDKLATEDVFTGALSERLLSALAPSSLSRLSSTNDDAFQSSQRLQSTPSTKKEDASTAMDLDACPSSQSAESSAQSELIDIEERMRRELRFLGAFPTDIATPFSARGRGGELDWSNRRDDEITAALRDCQWRLNDQITVNESRKSRLVERVKDRMARQEFEALRDTLEKQIEAGWQKRQKNIKKKPNALRGAAAAAAAAAAASAGRNHPDHSADGGRTPFPEPLLASLERRQMLVEGFKPMFDSDPARFGGIPPCSIHGDDLEEGAIPPIEDPANAEGWKESGLHCQPDTAKIPAVMIE